MGTSQKLQTNIQSTTAPTIEETSPGQAEAAKEVGRGVPNNQLMIVDQPLTNLANPSSSSKLRIIWV